MLLKKPESPCEDWCPSTGPRQLSSYFRTDFHYWLYRSCSVYFKKLLMGNICIIWVSVIYAFNRQFTYFIDVQVLLHIVRLFSPIKQWTLHDHTSSASRWLQTGCYLEIPCIPEVITRGPDSRYPSGVGHAFTYYKISKPLCNLVTRGPRSFTITYLSIIHDLCILY